MYAKYMHALILVDMKTTYIHRVDCWLYLCHDIKRCETEMQLPNMANIHAYVGM